MASVTHSQALIALLFLYREVLGINLPWLDGVQCPRTPKRIPWILTVAEVTALLSALPTDMALPASRTGRHRHAANGRPALAIKDVYFDSGVIAG